MQKEIWKLEDSLSKAKKAMGDKDYTIRELMNNLEAAEKETDALKKQLDEHPKTPRPSHPPPHQKNGMNKMKIPTQLNYHYYHLY